MGEGGSDMIGMTMVRAVAGFAAAVVLAVATLGAADANAQSAPAARTKVVVQVSDGDPAKWSLALNNVRNVQADLGAGNVDVEVVAYGPGIGMLLANSVVSPRLEEALAAGVKVVACENTMKGQKLARKDMADGIGYVQAGVVELIQKQQQGYAYIRP
jgi:intracellular sulfur oxidation DsrE/DsrF family protein